MARERPLLLSTQQEIIQPKLKKSLKVAVYHRLVVGAGGGGGIPVALKTSHAPARNP